MASERKRIVIKIGTGVLTREHNGRLNHAIIARLIQAISDLVVEHKHAVTVVSSGAVGAGLSALGYSERPKQVEQLQACAAVGQARLMQIYDTGFRNFDLKIAQILLTHDDFQSDLRSTNVSNTLTQLLSYPDVVPIVNENDSVAVFELKVGDNDQLSARLATLIEADLLIVLTSVAGLLRPGSTGSTEIVQEVHDIDEVTAFATAAVGKLSVGGMASKLEAIRIAVDAGIETVIAAGANPEQLPELANGKGFGTRFFAKPKPASNE